MAMDLRIFVFGLAALSLAACAAQKPDYDASRYCHEHGYEAGTSAYETCLRDARAYRLLEQQREEYEQMKRERDEWKTRRYP